MKILVVSDYRDALSAKSEAAFFTGIRGMGADVTVMTHPGCPFEEEFREAGVRVIDFHPASKWSRSESGRIRRELIEGGYDLLHLFNSKAICTGLRAAKRLPVKVVLYRGYVGNLNWWNPGDYLKFLHPRVDGILCAAPAGEEHIRRQCLFVHPMLRAIPKGHDVAWYDGVIPLPRKELNLPENAFLLVTVANARRMKGIRYLIEAMKRLPPERPVHLALVGSGLDSPSIRKRLINHPVRERVHFCGYRTDAWRILKSADALVLPSIYGEAITKAVIEAMAMRVPVILTDIPGNRGLIVHEKSGRVVPRKDPGALAGAIARYASGKDPLSEYAESAQERIRTRFTPKEAAANLFAFYSDLLRD